VVAASAIRSRRDDGVQCCSGNCRITAREEPGHAASRLLEAGVDVRFADLPMIEGATGKFLLQQMAAVAELEAGMISARTKGLLRLPNGEV
jgi:hypothetical protein